MKSVFDGSTFCIEGFQLTASQEVEAHISLLVSKEKEIFFPHVIL